jgi:hypothetical protein
MKFILLRFANGIPLLRKLGRFSVLRVMRLCDEQKGLQNTQKLALIEKAIVW